MALQRSSVLSNILHLTVYWRHLPNRWGSWLSEQIESRLSVEFLFSPSLIPALLSSLLTSQEKASRSQQQG